MKLPFASKFKIKDKQIALSYLTGANLPATARYVINNMLVVKGGTANFKRYDDSPNYTEITFSPLLKTSSYSVSITPSQPTSGVTGGNLGDYWVTDKTINGFKVYISGTATTTFDWLVFVKDLNFTEG